MNLEHIIKEAVEEVLEGEEEKFKCPQCGSSDVFAYGTCEAKWSADLDKDGTIKYPVDIEDIRSMYESTKECNDCGWSETS